MVDPLNRITRLSSGQIDLLQIHDELIFESPKNEVKKISKLIIDEMSSVTESDQHSFSIPLTVDLNTGENWGALH